MRRLCIVFMAVVVLALSITSIGVVQLSPQGPGSGPASPLWAVHAQTFPGGLSNGVRAHLDVALQGSTLIAAATSTSPTTATLNNVQMNDETTPDLPVDETQVVLKPSNPMVAIAAGSLSLHEGWGKALCLGPPGHERDSAGAAQPCRLKLTVDPEKGARTIPRDRSTRISTVWVSPGRSWDRSGMRP